MPLFDSHRTNLKSLKYGSDRPGGASSTQPFIKTPIPEDRLNRTSRVGLIFHSQDIDPERLKAYFKTTKGIVFRANQEILSQLGVQTQTQRLPNEGPYLSTTSVTQAGLTGIQTGQTVRNFISPFNPTGARDSLNNPLTYSGVVKFDQSADQNRLYQLVKEHLYEDGDPIQPFFSKLQSTANSIFNTVSGVGNLFGINTSGIGLVQGLVNRAISPFANPVLRSFPGGPGSELGIGKTNIYFADKRTLNKKQAEDLKTGAPERPDLEGKRYTPGPEPIEPLKQKSFSRVNYDRSPGKVKDGNRRDPFLTTGDESVALDKINAYPIYKSDKSDTSDIVGDLVNFRIAVIDNGVPDQKDFIHFRAFLNGFTDNYNAQWNGFRYPGRGEQLYKYGGFDRDFSISWTVYAQSKGELMPMYRKLNFLASSLAPDYGTNGFMKGNLVQLTVGGYLYEQPGFISSLTYTAPEDSPYETSILDNGTDSSVKQLPFRINVSSFSFIPIHTFRPERQENEFDSKRYIALQNESNNNYDSLR